MPDLSYTELAEAFADESLAGEAVIRAALAGVADEMWASFHRRAAFDLDLTRHRLCWEPVMADEWQADGLARQVALLDLKARLLAEEATRRDRAGRDGEAGAG